MARSWFPNGDTVINNQQQQQKTTAAAGTRPRWLPHGWTTAAPAPGSPSSSRGGWAWFPNGDTVINQQKKQLSPQSSSSAGGRGVARWAPGGWTTAQPNPWYPDGDTTINRSNSNNGGGGGKKNTGSARWLRHGWTTAHNKGETATPSSSAGGGHNKIIHQVHPRVRGWFPDGDSVVNQEKQKKNPPPSGSGGPPRWLPSGWTSIQPGWTHPPAKSGVVPLYDQTRPAAAVVGGSHFPAFPTHIATTSFRPMIPTTMQRQHQPVTHNVLLNTAGRRAGPFPQQQQQQATTSSPVHTTNNTHKRFNNFVPVGGSVPQRTMQWSLSPSTSAPPAGSFSNSVWGSLPSPTTPSSQSNDMTYSNNRNVPAPQNHVVVSNYKVYHLEQPNQQRLNNNPLSSFSSASAFNTASSPTKSPSPQQQYDYTAASKERAGSHHNTTMTTTRNLFHTITPSPTKRASSTFFNGSSQYSPISSTRHASFPTQDYSIYGSLKSGHKPFPGEADAGRTHTIGSLRF